MRGAFLTVDRPYGPIFDWLHHKIGSTHVTHHIDCTIPHYQWAPPPRPLPTSVAVDTAPPPRGPGRATLSPSAHVMDFRAAVRAAALSTACEFAREATDAIAKNFPDVYLYDPTPVHVAMWRVAKNCIAVKRDGTGRYQWAAP
eukprot:7388339-Prymnesium_polylepis.1